MKKLIKLSRFLKPYWKEAALSVVLLICVVFMDLSIPRLVQRIIDQGITPKNMDVVGRTTLIMLGISFLNTLFAIGNNILSVNASEAFSRDLREALFQKIQEFSYSNLDQLKTGNLIVRLTSDIAILQQTYRMSLRIGIRAPLIIIGSLVLMYSTNASLTLKVLPLLLLTAVVVLFFVSKMGPLFTQVQKKLDGLNTVLQENIAGVRVVKAFVRREHEEKRFEAANESFTGMHIRIMRFFATFSPALTMLVNLGVVIVIWVGGIQSINGTLSLGEIIAFTDYLMTTMAPLLIMAMLANNFASGMASAERVYEIFETVPDIRDMPDAHELRVPIKGRVVFQHVSFFYNDACNEKVLDDINLEAEPGQTVAILGATGSGKSTLVNLIPRFYDVTQGKITIDGIDVRAMTQDSLFAQIGVTAQETILFSGTVRENIRYGNPKASEEEMEQAAKAAQAHEFIMELPQGYDTPVAQRGVNLSGGQKQRIAIARAILCHPKILILDDSTSAVDVETESRIQAALNEMMKDSTSFIVAQRISTVLTADKIIVLDRGKIAAEGTHAELMKRSPIYKEIYDSQLGDGNHAVRELFANKKGIGAAAND
jgi:ATP-binding cassette subfamily B multidrug efflux pump